jgi:hypothetical protein
MTRQTIQHLIGVFLLTALFIEIASLASAALGSLILGVVSSGLLAITVVAVLAGIRQPHPHHP